MHWFDDWALTLAVFIPLVGLAAVLFIGLSAAVGAVSPAALSAPILVLFAYVLVAGRERWWRWLLGPVPLMALGIVALQLFWIGPFFGFVSYVGQRAPRLVFNPALVTTFDIQRLLELMPIRATIDVDRFSLSPAVWLPAVVGLAYSLRDVRARVPAALSLLGLGLLTMQWLYYPLAIVPSAGVFVEGAVPSCRHPASFLRALARGTGVCQIAGSCNRLGSGSVGVSQFARRLGPSQCC